MGRLCHESPPAQLSAKPPSAPLRFAPTGVRSLWGEEESVVSKVSKLTLCAPSLPRELVNGKIRVSLLEVNNVPLSSVL